jgi:dTDP-4-dehydrorhamnose reductase
MSILVIGANGLLGSNVAAIGDRRGLEITGTFHTNEPELPIPLYKLDVRDTNRFEELIEAVTPTAVINCAAMTDVDGCETDASTAREVNGRVPGNLAERCAQRDISFGHVSTDYVFDGTSQKSYPETAEPNPIQVYGQTKLEGDRAVLDRHDEALVTRLSFVYGVHQSRQELSGFPAWAKDQLTSDRDVPLFVDQRVTPTRAGHAAKTILDLLDQDANGVVNVACRSCVTPFEFGETFREFIPDSSGALVEAEQDSIDRQADRPRYTCLDTERVETLLGRPEPTLFEDLEQIATYFD